jgi:hypothetical protein
MGRLPWRCGGAVDRRARRRRVRAERRGFVEFRAPITRRAPIAAYRAGFPVARAIAVATCLARPAVSPARSAVAVAIAAARTHRSAERLFAGTEWAGPIAHRVPESEEFVATQLAVPVGVESFEGGHRTALAIARRLGRTTGVGTRTGRRRQFLGGTTRAGRGVGPVATRARPVAVALAETIA